LQVIWITTPLVLALQYFGAEKDIFAFERNAKTFFIALFVLLFLLPCLACFLDYMVRGVEVVSQRFGIRPTKKDGEEDHLGEPSLGR